MKSPAVTSDESLLACSCACLTAFHSKLALPGRRLIICTDSPHPIHTTSSAIRLDRQTISEAIDVIGARHVPSPMFATTAGARLPVRIKCHGSKMKYDVHLYKYTGVWARPSGNPSDGGKGARRQAPGMTSFNAQHFGKLCCFLTSVPYCFPPLPLGLRKRALPYVSIQRPLVTDFLRASFPAFSLACSCAFFVAFLCAVMP